MSRVTSLVSLTDSDFTYEDNMKLLNTTLTEKGKMQEFEKKYKNVRLVAEMVPQDVLRTFYKAADLHISASNSETYGMTVRECSRADLIFWPATGSGGFCWY